MAANALTGEQLHAITSAVAELRDEMVAAVQTLVRVPSQTGQEGAVQEVVARLMANDGLDVDVWEPDIAELRPYAEFVTLDGPFHNRPNVVGVRRGAGGGRSLILNGHIDTVEPGDEQAWQDDPLSGAIADGRIWGRGSCDMKGGVASNLFALRALRRAGISLQGDVVIQSTISEEDGGSGALATVLRGYSADAALISEPTDLAIVVAHGGSLMFRLHVPGLSAHACVRNEGVSAIENFAYLHKGLLAFEERHNAEIDHPLYAGMPNKAPLNIGTIHGGAWPSSVPEFVTAEGRAGLVPGETLDELKAALLAEVAALAKADPWMRNNPPRLEWLDGQFAPAGIAAEHDMVATLRNAVQETTGQAPAIEAATYGADMRHFVNSGGMPCVMFGAGDVRLAHAPNESIPIEQLLAATTATAAFVAAWCGIATA